MGIVTTPEIWRFRYWLVREKKAVISEYDNLHMYFDKEIMENADF